MITSKKLQDRVKAMIWLVNLGLRETYQIQGGFTITEDDWELLRQWPHAI